MLTDDEAKSYFAHNLKVYLAKANLTRADLARLCGESDQRLYLYANAKCLVTGGALLRISSALGTSADKLLAKPRKNLKNGT